MNEAIFGRYKLGTIVTYYLIWYAIPGKLALDVSDGILAALVIEFSYVDPLGIVINTRQVMYVVVFE